MSRPPESDPPAVWRLLGFVLPRSIRRLVYEPACLDLWRNHSLADTDWRGRLALWARFSGYFGAAVMYAVPRYAYEKGRAAATGRAVLIGVILLSLVLLVTFYPGLVQLSEVAGRP
ncbi:MAG: hypothetical protein V3U67_03790 [Gemmatimonadota bacterium]